MDWNLIIAICEIIGAIAIVVTLIYLTVQLRQNTLALKSSTWQAIQDAELQFDQFLASDPHLCDVFERGLVNGLNSFDKPAERWQYWSIGKMLVDLFQTHHYQLENRMIEAEWWKTWLTQYQGSLEMYPGFRDIVRDRRPHLRPSFGKLVDELLREAEAKVEQGVNRGDPASP